MRYLLIGMDVFGELKDVLVSAAQKLKGSARRVFMADTVARMGEGAQRQAERELGWNRNTIRKGEHERTSGITCVDAFNLRGAKPVESRLPNLRADIKAIVEGQCQTDPTFRSTRLYRRISTAEVRRQLAEQKGYPASELPSEETIRIRLNDMGYRPRTVQKSRPKKNSPKPMPFSTT